MELAVDSEEVCYRYNKLLPVQHKKGEFAPLGLQQFPIKWYYHDLIIDQSEITGYQSLVLNFDTDVSEIGQNTTVICGVVKSVRLFIIIIMRF